MKCRWDWNAASRRPKRSSRVAPSSLNSSYGLSRAIRECRLLAEIARAVVTMVCRGRSARPAMIQPSTKATTTMRASPIAEAISRARRSVPWCGTARGSPPVTGWSGAGLVVLLALNSPTTSASRMAPEAKNTLL